MNANTLPAVRLVRDYRSRRGRGCRARPYVLASLPALPTSPATGPCLDLVAELALLTGGIGAWR